MDGIRVALEGPVEVGGKRAVALEGHQFPGGKGSPEQGAGWVACPVLVRKGSRVGPFGWRVPGLRLHEVSDLILMAAHDHL